MNNTAENYSLSIQIRKFLEFCEIAKNQSKKTIENYQHYLNRFLKWAGNIDVSTINLELIQNYRLYLSRLKDPKTNDYIGIKTQNYHIIALRAFLKFLVKHDIETLSPEKIDLSKIPERSVEFLSRDELERLFNTVQKNTKKGLRDLAILETLYSTGLRVSELVNLNRDQVDLERKEFMVRGKGKKPRIVFLSGRAVEAISDYIKSRDDNFSPLFITLKRGREDDDLSFEEKKRLTPYTIQELVRNYSRLAGIAKKVTPHTLRHSFATEMLINGADIRSVQELLGHASITTTQIYTHITNKKLREVHEKFHK